MKSDQKQEERYNKFCNEKTCRKRKEVLRPIYVLIFLMCISFLNSTNHKIYADTLYGDEGIEGFRKRLQDTETGVVIPMDTREYEKSVFTPNENGAGMVGIATEGIHHQIELEAIWEDTGVQYRILPVRNQLSAEPYRRRYGLSDGSIPEQMQYGGTIVLSEPEGFDSYHWMKIDPKTGNRTEIEEGGDQRIMELSVPKDNTDYVCIANITGRQGRQFIYHLGHNYGVRLVNLPVICGIRIRR